MVKGKAGKQFTTLQRDRLDYIRYVCSSPGFSIFSISESTQQYLFFFIHKQSCVQLSQLGTGLQRAWFHTLGLVTCLRQIK